MSVGVEVWIALSIFLFNFLFLFSYSLRPSSSLSLSLSLPPSCLTTVAFLELLWASSGYNIQSCALLRWHLREFLASSRNSWLRVKHKKTPSSCGGKPDPAQKWGSGLKTRFGNEKHSFIPFSQSQASTGCQHMFAPFWVFECELCKTIVYEYSMLKYMELLCGWIIVSAGSLPLGSAGGRAAGRTTSWEKCDEHIAKQLLCVVPPRYLSWLIRVQYCGFLGDTSIVFIGLSIYNWGGGELHQNSVVFPWIPIPVLPANHRWQLEKKKTTTLPVKCDFRNSDKIQVQHPLCHILVTLIQKSQGISSRHDPHIYYYIPINLQKPGHVAR